MFEALPKFQASKWFHFLKNFLPQFNISIRSHSAYIMNVKECADNRYKIRHVVFWTILIFYMIRLTIGIIVYLKFNVFFQEYQDYDIFVFSGLKIFLDGDQF